MGTVLVPEGLLYLRYAFADDTLMNDVGDSRAGLLVYMGVFGVILFIEIEKIAAFCQIIVQNMSTYHYNLYLCLAKLIMIR